MSSEISPEKKKNWPSYRRSHLITGLILPSLAMAAILLALKPWWDLSYCDLEMVATVAPVSPMYITNSGHLFNLAAGTETVLLEQTSTGRTMLQALWSPDESALFALVILAHPHPAPNNTLTCTFSVGSYLMAPDGSQPVELLHLDENNAGSWIESLRQPGADYHVCRWTSNTEVKCTIAGHDTILKKD